jgi:hypothetical protein
MLLHTRNSASCFTLTTPPHSPAVHLAHPAVAQCFAICCNVGVSSSTAQHVLLLGPCGSAVLAPAYDLVCWRGWFVWGAGSDGGKAEWRLGGFSHPCTWLAPRLPLLQCLPLLAGIACGCTHVGCGGPGMQLIRTINSDARHLLWRVCGTAVLVWVPEKRNACSSSCPATLHHTSRCTTCVTALHARSQTVVWPGFLSLRWCGGWLSWSCMCALRKGELVGDDNTCN